MTEKEVRRMQDATVVTAKIELNYGDILEEMAMMKTTLDVYLAKFVYDEKTDCYARCRGARATVAVYPDQYLGHYSRDGRIEMFSARVKEVKTEATEYFPDIKVGARICICFDSLIEVGCVRSVKNGSSETRYAMSGYLRGHDFDDDPVEPLSDADMRTTIARMAENEAETETTAQVVLKAAEADTGAKAAVTQMAAKSKPEAEPVQAESAQTGSADYSGGVLSQSELNTLISDMEASSPAESAENATAMSQTGDQAMNNATLTTGQITGQAAGSASSVAPVTQTAGQKKPRSFSDD